VEKNKENQILIPGANKFGADASKDNQDSPLIELRERVAINDLEASLNTFFGSLLALGYKHISFKIVRPFLEVS
jgi:hypothetical protein